MKTIKVLKMLSVLALTGCTHLHKSQTKLGRQLAEESRALTTGVVDALQLQPPDHRDLFTATALEFARQDQRLEGLPVKPFNAPALVETNLAPAEVETHRTEARADLQRRFALENKLLARQFAVTEKLLDFGIEHETARNARIRAWTKWLGGGSLLIGALVALCTFFPAAAPLVGRLL